MSALPRPDLLLFDADCGLCGALALRARDHDRRTRFRIEPFQNWSDADLAALGLTRAACERAMQVVTASGRRLAGAFAVNHYLWRTGGWGRLVALFYLLPPLLLLEMAGYALVARYRTRISGWLGLARCATCPAPRGQ